MTGSVSVADQRTLFRLLRYGVENETFPTKQKHTNYIQPTGKTRY